VVEVDELETVKEKIHYVGIVNKRIKEFCSRPGCYYRAFVVSLTCTL